MPPNPFVLITPGATRGLGVALTRQFLATTSLPVYASHRTTLSDNEISKHILKNLGTNIDPKRLNLLKLDLTSEDSIKAAADALGENLAQKGLLNPYLHTAFITGGILYPEKNPSQLDWDHIKESFQINTISHLLIMKHFSQFLPGPTTADLPAPAKWAHITARVGSISDNHRGGWWSYRCSKAALNQAIKTFDIYLQQHKIQAICVGIHPGTVKTDLSKEFWASAAMNEPFTPNDAAMNLINVVENLSTYQRGKVWDWAGKEVHW
ncbi:C factor cell-cell signaling protein [Pholiota conissans]|uniref:C factor cell-cell signaling protein n=1 Tax=Pholiota conissans TaxID=109636 RepID=A0A9P5ZDF6_9AGAR|nr:C factor cell-cell signaling protein [Pholiota conissans]